MSGIDSDGQVSVAEAVLQDCVGNAKVVAVQDVSPRLGGSVVLRVRAQLAGERLSTFFLKSRATDRESPLGLNASQAFERERAVYLRAGNLTPPGISIPKARVSSDGRWICMDDNSNSLGRQFTPALARVAMHRLAAAASWGASQRCEARIPLVRSGWMTYAGAVDEACENLDYVERHGGMELLPSAVDISILRALVSSADHISGLASDLPQTLIHGDLNPSNCGVTEDGKLLLIDFEQVGIGPVGSDAATFTMLYGRFGGSGAWTYREAVEAYSAALTDLEEDVSRSDVLLAFALWQCTWGIHLRLGPGLSYLIRSGDTVDRAAVADIRDGLRDAIELSHLVLP